ncbi:hypothetical protein TB1_029002 [Malus domestica]
MSDEQSTNSGSIAHRSNSLLSVDNSKSLITINATAQLPVKPMNYLSWRAPFITLLIGYDLLRYVDGTYPCPEKSNTSPSTSAYNLWLCQDQLLQPHICFRIHAILTFVSEQVASFIASAPTSKATWDKLKQLYANRAQARVMCFC